MDVLFTPDQQMRLEDLASHSGCPADQLVRDAVARFLKEEEDAFVSSVEAGLEDVAQGRIQTLDQVQAELEEEFGVHC